MKNLESEFIREFNSEVRVSGCLNIYDVPLPPIVGDWSVSNCELYAIKGIDVIPYSSLNQTIVKLVPRGQAVKRKVIDGVTKSFKRDKDGNYVYKDYKIPTGCSAVVSNISLGVSYKEYINPKGNYQFVDVVSKNEYIYIVPDTVLYKVHQTALALSSKSMKGYNGYSVLSWRKGTLFLYVIPYSHNRKYVDTKILKTKYSVDFSEEIRELLDYWQNIGYIPNIVSCELHNGLNYKEDRSNLCLHSLRVSYPTYSPVETLSRGDVIVYGGSTNG